MIIKKKTILIIAVGAIAVCSLPFFFTQTTNAAISTATSLISSLATLTTLVIAVLLYSKYGVEKSVVKKQSETVFSLLSELKKTYLYLNKEDVFLQIFLGNLSNEYWRHYENENLLFNMGYGRGLKNIWTISDNIFLPASIEQKIRPLKLMLLIERPSHVNGFRVTVPGVTPFEQGNYDERDEKSFGLLNGSAITLKEFSESWIQVINQSKKFLEEHSSVPIELNFDNN